MNDGNNKNDSDSKKDNLSKNSNTINNNSSILNSELYLKNILENNEMTTEMKINLLTSFLKKPDSNMKEFSTIQINPININNNNFSLSFPKSNKVTSINNNNSTKSNNQNEIISLSEESSRSSQNKNEVVNKNCNYTINLENDEGYFSLQQGNENTNKNIVNERKLTNDNGTSLKLTNLIFEDEEENKSISLDGISCDENNQNIETNFTTNYDDIKGKFYNNTAINEKTSNILYNLSDKINFAGGKKLFKVNKKDLKINKENINQVQSNNQIIDKSKKENEESSVTNESVNEMDKDKNLNLNSNLNNPKLKVNISKSNFEKKIYDSLNKMLNQKRPDDQAKTNNLLNSHAYYDMIAKETFTNSNLHNINIPFLPNNTILDKNIMNSTQNFNRIQIPKVTNPPSKSLLNNLSNNIIPNSSNTNIINNNSSITNINNLQNLQNIQNFQNMQQMQNLPFFYNQLYPMNIPYLQNINTNQSNQNNQNISNILNNDLNDNSIKEEKINHINRDIINQLLIKHIHFLNSYQNNPEIDYLRSIFDKDNYINPQKINELIFFNDEVDKYIFRAQAIKNAIIQQQLKNQSNNYIELIESDPSKSQSRERSINKNLSVERMTEKSRSIENSNIGQIKNERGNENVSRIILNQLVNNFFNKSNKNINTNTNINDNKKENMHINLNESFNSKSNSNKQSILDNLKLLNSNNFNSIKQKIEETKSFILGNKDKNINLITSNNSDVLKHENIKNMILVNNEGIDNKEKIGEVTSINIMENEKNDKKNTEFEEINFKNILKERKEIQPLNNLVTSQLLFSYDFIHSFNFAEQNSMSLFEFFTKINNSDNILFNRIIKKYLQYLSSLVPNDLKNFQDYLELVGNEEEMEYKQMIENHNYPILLQKTQSDFMLFIMNHFENYILEDKTFIDHNLDSLINSLFYSKVLNSIIDYFKLIEDKSKLNLFDETKVKDLLLFYLGYFSAENCTNFSTAKDSCTKKFLIFNRNSVCFDKRKRNSIKLQMVYLLLLKILDCPDFVKENLDYKNKVIVEREKTIVLNEIVNILSKLKKHSKLKDIYDKELTKNYDKYLELTKNFLNTKKNLGKDAFKNSYNLVYNGKLPFIIVNLSENIKKIRSENDENISKDFCILNFKDLKTYINKLYRDVEEKTLYRNLGIIKVVGEHLEKSINNKLEEDKIIDLIEIIEKDDNLNDNNENKNENENNKEHLIEKTNNKDENNSKSKSNKKEKNKNSEKDKMNEGDSNLSEFMKFQKTDNNSINLCEIIKFNIQSILDGIDKMIFNIFLAENIMTLYLENYEKYWLLPSEKKKLVSCF